VLVRALADGDLRLARDMIAEIRKLLVVITDLQKAIGAGTIRDADERQPFDLEAVRATFPAKSLRVTDPAGRAVDGQRAASFACVEGAAFGTGEAASPIEPPTWTWSDGRLGRVSLTCESKSAANAAPPRTVSRRTAAAAIVNSAWPRLAQPHIEPGLRDTGNPARRLDQKDFRCNPCDRFRPPSVDVTGFFNYSLARRIIVNSDSSLVMWCLSAPSSAGLPTVRPDATDLPAGNRSNT
jgi:hypothetical protein